MWTTYQKEAVDFKELDQFEIPYEPLYLSVNYNQVSYEFLLNRQQSSDKLVVFGSGAFNAEKMKPPIFQRYSWMSDFTESTIFYNDPTLYNGSLNLGWGQGTEERFYLEELATILKVILKNMNITNDKTLFYGSSAGGYMSLFLAGFLKGARALVNNPQTIVTNYYQSHVDNMLAVAYPSLSRDEILEKYNERLNVLEFYKKIEFVPKITYIQNIACSHDFNKHYWPFIKGLKEMDENIFNHEIEFILYANKEQGHNPLEKAESIAHIQSVLNKM